MSGLLELFGHAVQGTATPEQWAGLQALLEKDVDARRQWREYVNVHAGLKTYCAMPGTVADSMPEAGRRRPWLLAAAALLLAAVAGWWMSTPSSLGRLSQASHARWNGREPGISIRPGRVDLTAGFAELTLVNGIRLILESPVAIDLISAERARLVHGRVVAHVPPEGRGFAVDTPRARLVDLGTEFGVGVREDGETEVQVFQGEVVAELKDAASRRLEAGSALRLEASKPPADIPYEPERFVRLFPTERQPSQPAGPIYNRSRFDAVHAVPATAVAIDGDLAEWDRSGAIYSACWPPYHESHTLEGMLMYDERFLYVAARVGDPAPLRSVMDPKADPAQYAWRGGSIVLRLAPGLAWPLAAKGRTLADSRHPDYGRRPEDVDERISHLVFWYHRPSEKARLQVSYGLDFHGERTDPPGWSGAIRPQANGLGYVLEYAIPWELLHAKAPQAGAILPCSWTVHWSDLEGKVSRGHLVEVVNLDELPYRFLLGRTWGQAVFHERGNLSPGTVLPRQK